MFNTFVHFAIFAYQHRTVYRKYTMYCQCSIRWPRLDCVLFMQGMSFVKTSMLRNSKNFKTNKKNFIFFYTTILFLSPLYTTLYTTRRPIAIAIVEVTPRGRVMYSNTFPLSYANKHTRLT